ncbi:MAG: FISUMP domain-containing protein [Bacteroidales bacterium]|nr:FISUMP domain-containing protein [Bacteroidales bacterium]
MKKIILFVFLLLANTALQAQDYQISFTGSGLSLDVDSIHAINLTQGTSVNLNSGDILNLVGTIGINSLKNIPEPLTIYPNPMLESSIIAFDNPKEGMVCLEIYNGMGIITSSYCENICIGSQKFEISGLKTGYYSVKVSTSSFEYTTNIVSLGQNSGQAYIKNQSNGTSINPEIPLKSTKSIVQMQYNDGETILFKGFSDNYVRFLTLTPSQNQTVNFAFVSCIDVDGNNYAAVTIGGQTIMAENLRTTKLNDGTPIPHVNDYTTWDNSINPAYCWYDTTQSLNSTYGLLYNWYAVDSDKLCPTGWHVPANSEWTDLINFLWPQNLAGGKLKETGTAHWSSPNTGATNETGFSALPGGYRYGSGVFIGIGNKGWWWASTENSIYGNDMNLNYDDSNINTGSSPKNSGLSVRCFMD